MLYGTIQKEAKRIALLEGYQILDTVPERDFDDIAKLAASVCETPIALIVFIDEDRQWFKAKVGMDQKETSRAVAFCHYTIQSDKLMIVKDALLDPRFRNNPLVVSDPKIRFYAGAPLVTPEGFTLGTVCVIDLKPRTLSEEQKQGLQALARQVLSQLQLRKQLRDQECLKRELEKRVHERTRELELTAEEAQSANRMKNTFLANMSHEIRTPIGAMIGFADLMTDPAITDEERNHFADVIKRNGDHLQKIINDILDISKIEAGHLKIETVEFSPRQLVTETASLLQIKAQEKGLWLHTHFDNRLPGTILSDPTRFKQILMNIIGNAIKFTSFGGIEVLITYDDMDPEDSQIRIEVQDTGPGLSQEQSQKLFQAFSQADESTTRKHGGTGLGLSLSKRLANLLGGDITLKESLLGQGSTFLITLSADARHVHPARINENQVIYHH